MRIVKLTDETKKNLMNDLLKRSPNNYSQYEATVNEIIENVKANKDQAIFEYTRKFDRYELTAENIKVTPEEIENGVKYVKVPDIDIRLDNSLLDMESLPENLRYFVSDKLPSGLEDIQIRFIRPCDLGKPNPVYHETLIMFGPESTRAKHQEHRDVYQWVRNFSELEVPLEETALRTHAGKAKHYISMIKDMFRGKVSQKLFLNAKNKDYAGLDEETIISFSEQDIRLFEGYFNGLRDRINSVYAQLRQSTPSANLMKARDQRRIQDIYDALVNTINYYNAKVGMPLIEVKKPAK